MKSALIALSGGMDSATVLGEAINQGRTCYATSFYYGSKHGRIENEAAKKVAAYYGVHWQLLDLSGFMSTFRSALTSSDMPVPDGHYEEENMKQTVVPNRNLIFISILTGLAVSDGCDEIWLGVHQGDRVNYPDCRIEFIESAQQTIKLATCWNSRDKYPILGTPFLNTDKLGILKAGYGHIKPVPYHLTRTCYTENEISCGRCGACSERREAYQLLGKEDPISYAYTGPLPTKK